MKRKRIKSAPSPAVEEAPAAAAAVEVTQGTEPEWVTSYEALAQIFSCHSHSFPRWKKKHKDAPKPRQNGGHNVQAWREFFSRHTDIGLEVEAEQKSFLENRLREEKLKDLVRENARKDGELIEVSMVETWLADRIEQQRQLMQQVYERDLPAKLEGLRVPQIVEKMIEARKRIQKPLQDVVKLISETVETRKRK